MRNKKQDERRMNMNMKIVAGLMAVALAVTAFQARAEVKEVKLARQFGLHYLPLVLMEKHKLVEKAAAAANIELKANWLQISASGINESLLSGAIDVSATGTGPLVLIWDRTYSNLKVKGIAAVSEVPMILTSRNPSFKTLKGLSAKDRIAMPAVALGSMQAVTLKAAAVDMFGKEAVNKFDSNVVAMAHPDAAAALLSGKSEVNAHFTAAPYSYMELQDPAIHRVLSSYDVWGGQSTLITINTTTKFYDQNPKVVKAVFDALREACNLADKDRKQALADYISVTNEKLSPEVQAAFLNDKEINFQVAPRGLQKVAEFMFLAGGVKQKSASWKDLFFPIVYGESGS
jgi:NitT/TauT family transport system substrate-binding protein